MSQANVYSIIGGNNVKRNMTSLNIESREVMKSAQVLSLSGLSSMSEVFASVRVESNVCIFAGVTELLSDAESTGAILSTVDPVLSEMMNQFRAFCNARPDLRLMLAPPLYLSKPLWYRNGLPEIGARFSSCFSASPPSSLILLPGFTSQDLMPDGMNLTPVSGLHFMLHLFDQSESKMRLLKSTPEDQSIRCLELARQNQDRIIYIEQDQRRLTKLVDDKLATSAEFDDWTQNRSDEDWIVITG